MKCDSREDQSWCPIGKGCLLYPLHRRLDDAHRLWHLALENYESPDDFRTHLNSCIQTLRTVTFVLQKHKASIPSFEAWYSIWQDRMRADPVMTWAVAARNRIVKQGDLQTTSLARVTVHWSYADSGFREYEVDPSKSTAEILAEAPIGVALPDELFKDGVLSIERRWMVDDLPGLELLEVLAHVYGTLLLVVLDAHNQLEVPITKRPWAQRAQVAKEYKASDADGRPDCMIAFGDARTRMIKLATGEGLTPSLEKGHPPPDIAEISRRRYGAPPSLTPSPKGEHTLHTLVQYMFGLAKTILVRDGYHLPMAFLVSGDGTMFPYGTPVDDRAEKYVLWRRLAAEVEKRRIERVLFVTEVWVAPIDPANAFRPAVESPQRQEALAVFGAEKGGQEITMTCIFQKNAKGRVEFREEQTLLETQSAFLEPIRAVWNQSRS